MRFLILVFMFLLAGCSSSSWLQPKPEKVEKKAPPARSLHSYVGEMATQLSQYSRPLKPGASVAVTSFFKDNELGADTLNNQGAGLSNQVQESFITYLTQMGLQVVEFRIQRSINLSTEADSILSRDIDKLKERHKFDLILTGSVSESIDSFTIHARLIDMVSSKTVSAASISLPKETLWGEEQVQMRDGLLHRSQY
ncbi:FlgO family outer membrane protein [Pseudoalteromonas umbrosa]|uniref:FlgO family outer membrane protein n=1 Tax=Pseudoalteromonas umbrosa TaxID=3048489 RepID=UPI0024C444E1|nr:FlgO family outer membrane protein [Pseudoalteromonas sp. B95]MDK1287433.1 FlgO family outer membrane protein [Pseudoalteromonas sp. B95]